MGEKTLQAERHGPSSRVVSMVSARVRQTVLAPYSSAIAGFVVVFVYLTATQSVFLTWGNWQNILRTNAVILVLALGVTYVVLTGGIDLSVAAMVAAAAMIFGITIRAGVGWPVAVLITVGFGCVVGAVNGTLIGGAGLSFFVVTLGALSIYQAFALLVTGGDTVSLYAYPQFSSVQSLANNDIGPIPAVAVICLGLYLLGAAVLRYTAFGRAIYAVGSNPQAARLNGIRVGGVLVAAYTVGGVTAGMAAVLQSGRLGGSAPQTDPTLLLTVIAAVLIGGTSYSGGEGGLLGTAIGVLFLGVVQNGLILTGVSTYWQGVVSGLILILAVGLTASREHAQRWRSRLRARSAGAIVGGVGEPDVAQDQTHPSRPELSDSEKGTSG